MYAIELERCFGINNLQVIEGYRYESIPHSVLALAVGTLGKWMPGVQEPQLEITHHHEGSRVWRRLPERLRTDAFRVNGTAAELVPVLKSDPLHRFYGGVPKPLKLKPHAVVQEPKPINLEELFPDFLRSLECDSVGPRPQMMAKPDPPSPRPKAAAPASVGPKIPEPQDTVMVRGKMVSAIPHDDPPQKETCKALKGDGGRCGRAGTMDGYCGYHAKQTGLSKR